MSRACGEDSRKSCRIRALEAVAAKVTVFVEMSLGVDAEFVLPSIVPFFPLDFFFPGEVHVSTFSSPITLIRNNLYVCPCFLKLLSRTSKQNKTETSN